MKKVTWLVVSSLIALSLIGCKANVTPSTTPTGTPSPSPTQQVPVVTPTPMPEPAATPTAVRYTLSTSVNPPNSGAVSISTGQYGQDEKIQVTVIAYAGYGFDHWSGDVSSNSSSIIVSMDSNKVLVANFADISPPVISNVVTTNRTDTKITITWNTNEPATSRIEYGITSAYGSISSDQQLVNSHSLTLSGLIPNTDYFFRIESVDAAGNEGLLPGDVFTKEPWMAVTYLVYVQGTKVFYNLINDSSQTIIVTKVELADQNGLVRHTDESTVLEVHNIGPLLSGDTLKESFSNPIYSNFSGWRVSWYCLNTDLTRFIVTSNPISP